MTAPPEAAPRDPTPAPNDPTSAPIDPTSAAHDSAPPPTSPRAPRRPGRRRRPRQRHPDPASLLPLRWGRYRDRVGIGLVLIAGGLVQLQGALTYDLVPLIWGSTAHMAGWLIMPARGWRRLVPLLPSTLVVWLLLAGPAAVITLIVPFLCWLLVRHRPWRSLLAAGPVVLNGVLFATLARDYEWMPLALAVSALVLVGSAWWAAALARSASA